LRAILQIFYARDARLSFHAAKTNFVMGSRQPYAGLPHKAKRYALHAQRRDGQNPATGHAGRFAGPE
jgi:hypothetical protein